MSIYTISQRDYLNVSVININIITPIINITPVININIITTNLKQFTVGISNLYNMFY